MSDSVFMSEELQDKVELEEKKPAASKSTDPDQMLWVKLIRDGKRSKKLPVRLYEEYAENTSVRRKLELLLEKEEFLSVAKNLPTGFHLTAGDDDVTVREFSHSPFIKVNADNGLFYVQLTF